MADRLNRKAQKQAHNQGRLSADSGNPNHMKMKDENPNLERMGQEGKYSVFVLYAAPDNPQGYVIVPVIIPNKKEFKRVKRQFWLVRKRLRKTVWYKNNYGFWQSIEVRNPYVVSAVPHAVEGKVINTPDGKKKIIIAGADTPHFN